MLYVSTRNPADTYTAYRALHEDTAPDGGQYVPFHLPVFTQEELLAFRTQSFGTTVSQILNTFFGLRLSSWEIECAIGRTPVKLESVGQRLTIAELWHNPEGDGRQIFDSLYKLMSKNNTPATGWPIIAIKIALLFAICSTASERMNHFDIAVASDDFSEISAVCYCEKMGLPVHLLICACDENSSVWDFINKGEFGTGIASPKYFESFLYLYFGPEQVQAYQNARQKHTAYSIDEACQQILRDGLFAAVVSSSRIDTVISSMRSTNQYTLDSGAAFSYGALQDYRAYMGISNDTLILSKQSPANKKE